MSSAQTGFSPFNVPQPPAVVSWSPDDIDVFAVGNVRELMNVVERAVSLTGFNQITPLNLPLSILESVKGAARPTEESFRSAKRRVIEEFESRYLSEMLWETGGNVSEAARRCGMKRSAFQRLIAKYSLQTLEFRR